MKDFCAEVNFDGLVGPTHHYGGYAYGNIASMLHKKQISYPKKAALQGLEKMKLLLDLGLPQAVLPPHLRPSFVTLRALGFKGSDAQIFEKAAHVSPALFYELCSSAFMWAANSATISPSSDTKDGMFHLTVANLNSQFHRSIEAEESHRLFRSLFPDENLFVIHAPLPKGGEFGDEGSANHTRFCKEYGKQGVHLFIYGKSAFESKRERFPFRQAKEASEAIARLHGLDLDHTFFIRQHPRAIESGVFHNDVISVGNQDIFLYHEHAFVDIDAVIKKIQKICPLQSLCVTEKMLPLKEAVKNYFFNGQLVTLPNGTALLLLPKECEKLNLEWLPLQVTFIDVSESMRNGGGPACLRLRCVLNEEERQRVHPHIFLTETLYFTLVDWVDRYFRDQLTLQDLADPSLLLETKEALDILTQILHLGSLYEFQREIGSFP
jgi:succinylarginine dihydrolase